MTLMSDDTELPRDRSHGHDVMEAIKIELVLDGDLAATLQNLALDAIMNGRIDKLIFCGHTGPKLQAFIELVQSRLDIENRVE
jgi:hypothetical protein